MRGMRTTFALLLAVAGNAQAGTADCDGDAARVLHAAAHAATDARAYWLDGTRIRWPAQPADARYRLVASSSAGLCSCAASGLVRHRVTDPYSDQPDRPPTRGAATSADLDASPRTPALKPAGWDRRAAPAPRRWRSTDMAIYELHVRDFSIGDASVPPATAASTWPSPSRSQRHAPPARAGRRRPDRRAPAAGVRHRQRARSRLRHAAIRAGGRARQRRAAGRGDGRQRRTPTASTGATTRSTSTRPKAATPAMRPTARCASSSSADGAGAARAGLRVGMDVVYNHTTAIRPERRSVLDRIVPGYYHRLDANGDGRDLSTCCDNTATEHR
jgi:pullulanase